jgi:hypothetical protein
MTIDRLGIASAPAVLRAPFGAGSTTTTGGR